MDDKGFGDANNRSETLHHAMLVRTHTFTAHRRTPKTACTTVCPRELGCSTLTCPKKPQPCPPYSLYCKGLACATSPTCLRHQPNLCAASPSSAPATAHILSAPPAYLLRRQPILRAATAILCTATAYPGRKDRELPLCAPSCPHTPKSYLSVENSHMTT